MPEVNLFSLSAETEWNEDFISAGGSISAEIYGEIEANVCKGIDLSLDVKAAAEITAKLRLLILGLEGQGEVLAHAGVTGRLKVYTNLFKKYGVSGKLDASAELSAAGRLSAYFDSEMLATSAADLLSGIELELFRLFLKEVYAGGGVFGKASFAAYAQGWFEASISFGEDKTEFTVGGGAGVAWGAGAGADWYLKGGLKNPKRLLLQSTGVITRELETELKKHLPESAFPAVDMLSFITPMAMRAAYDVGQKSVQEGVLSPQQIVLPFLEAFADSLQKFFIDKISEMAGNIITNMVYEALTALSGRTISAAERATVEEAANNVQDVLADGTVTLQDTDEILTLVITITQLVTPEFAEKAAKPLSLFWAAVAAGQAVLEIHEISGQAEARVLGISREAKIKGFQVPAVQDMPEVVYNEFIATVPDFNGTELRFNHLVDYLLRSSSVELLKRYAPAVVIIIDRLEQQTGITPGEIFEFGLQGSIGGNLTQTQLYERLKNFTSSLIDDFLEEYVFIPYEQNTNADATAKKILEQSVKPSISILKNYLFTQLDGAFSNPSLLQQAKFLDMLQTGLSIALYKVLVKNFVVFEEIISTFVRENMVTSFTTLEQEVLRDETHAYIQNTVNRIDNAFPAIPGLQTLTTEQITAVQRFSGVMLNIAGECFGDSVFTSGRIIRHRDAMEQTLLSLDDKFDWTKPDLFVEAIETIGSCAFIPDERALRTLFVSVIETSGDQFAIILRRAPSALSDLLLALTAPRISDLSNLANEKYAELANQVEEVLEELADVVQVLDNVKDRIIFLGSIIDEALLSFTLAVPPIIDSDFVDTLITKGREQLLSVGNTLSIPMAYLLPAIEAFEVLLRSFFTPIEKLLLLFLRKCKQKRFILKSIDAAIATVPLSEITQDGFSAQRVTELLTTAHNEMVHAFLGTLSDTQKATLTIISPVLNHDDLQALLPVDILSLLVKYITENSDFGNILRKKCDLFFTQTQKRFYEDRKDTVDQLKISYTTEKKSLEPQKKTTISVISPLPLDENIENIQFYGAQVPFALSISPAGANWAKNGRGKRIHIFMNNKPVTVPTEKWNYSSRQKSLSLSTLITIDSRIIKQGMNTLEVSVCNDENVYTRTNIIFAVDAKRGIDDPLFEVVAGASRVNPIDNDHTRTIEEFVVFRCLQGTKVNLQGWRVRDAAGHTYTFDNMEISAGKEFSLYTGGKPSMNTKTKLYWGRKSAVWNNTGDTIFLLDRQGTVRAQHLYGAMKER